MFGRLWQELFPCSHALPPISASVLYCHHFSGDPVGSRDWLLSPHARTSSVSTSPFCHRCFVCLLWLVWNQYLTMSARLAVFKINQLSGNYRAFAFVPAHWWEHFQKSGHRTSSDETVWNLWSFRSMLIDIQSDWPSRSLKTFNSDHIEAFEQSELSHAWANLAIS